MRDHLSLQLDKMGGNFQRRQKERWMDCSSTNIHTIRSSSTKAEQDLIMCKVNAKYLLLAYIQNRMAAFLTCGNGRITLLKTVVQSIRSCCCRRRPALLTYYLLSGFSYH
jgi:hypothetical protein